MEPTLEALASDLVLIQGYLQSQEQPDCDEADRDRLNRLVIEARDIMLVNLRELADWTPQTLRMSLGVFKDAVVNLMLTGMSSSSLGFDTPTATGFVNHGGLFSASTIGSSRYVYEFIEQFSVFAIQSLPPETLFAMLFADVMLESENPDNYASRQLFNSRVFIKIAALLYAIESAGGKFDRPDDGGEQSEAPVPRDPIDPQLTGEAEEQIPEASQQVDAIALNPAIR
jgi:hypothetical protein